MYVPSFGGLAADAKVAKIKIIINPADDHDVGPRVQLMPIWCHHATATHPPRHPATLPLISLSSHYTSDNSAQTAHLNQSNSSENLQQAKQIAETTLSESNQCS